MPAVLTHIVIPIVLQVSLNAFAVGFTSPSSPIRLAILPLIVACVYQVIPICLQATERVVYAALLGAHSLSFLLQYIDTALLTKWSAEAGGPTTGAFQQKKSRGQQEETVERHPTIGERIQFGYYAAVTTRNVGTPFEVRGVPRFSNQDPSYVPSSITFLRQKLVSLIFYYIVLDLFTFASQPEQNSIIYNPARVPWIDTNNLSFERLIIRSTTVLGFWVSLYCIIDGYMATLAIVSVALGFSDPRSWPPGFGSIGDAYTVRRFWSIFWHQYQQQKISSSANFIVSSILRLPKSRPISRYMNLILVFLISGIEHSLSDVAQGIPWQQSGAIRFFGTQAVGIIFEDAVIRAFVIRRFRPLTGTLSRFVGYLWVLIFLFWSTPVWIYPSLYRNTGEAKDMIVPFSAVRWVSGRLRY